MKRRLTVDSDIPALLAHAQKLAREAWPDEDWTLDRNAILRGAITRDIDEFVEVLDDNAKLAAADAEREDI